MNKKADKERLQKWIYGAAVLVSLFILIRGIVVAGQQIHHTELPDKEIATAYALTDMNNAWICSGENGDGQEVALPYEVTDDMEQVRFTKDVTGLFRDGDIIKFDNLRQGITVFADEEPIYEVNTTALTDQLSFTDYQLVVLPNADEIRELTFVISHKITEKYTMPQVSFGPYYAARSEILHQDLQTLCILVILAFLLAAVVLIGGYSRTVGYHDTRFIDIACFVLLAIVWGYTDSYLPVLHTVPQEVLGILCYMSIMALPIPMCRFVWDSCQKRGKVLPFIANIGALNLILQSILSMMGVIKLHNTFYAAHVLILAVVVACIISVYKTEKEEQRSGGYQKEMNILNVGIVMLAVFALLSLVLYWKKGSTPYRNCMLTGIILFSIVLIFYVVHHFVRTLQENQIKLSEIRINERLSMFDSLTGLPNRRSFEKKLDEIEAAEDKNTDAVLFMLDVNGLKLVNDRYGHTAGDDLIVSAARVIQMTYGGQGSCYRIGGDEFAVILEKLSVPMATYDQLFDAHIAKINATSRWKLSIAKGCSHLIHSTGKRLSISDWKQEADVNMYRNKVAMIGNHARDFARDLREIIDCIISTIEAKDVYTAAHSDRVRELSCCIANKLGVSDLTMRNLEMAAHLHDIGKIGVPDIVLQKPSRLTDEEYQIIKRHSDIGASIIGQAKGMAEIAEIVLHHHERWDGKGYPGGLAKEEIPLESRIIALADSIDAMTSKRVYRDSISLDECFEEIKKNAGIMYDPAITQIVVQNWSSIVDIVMTHPKRLILNRSAEGRTTQS